MPTFEPVTPRALLWILVLATVWAVGCSERAPAPVGERVAAPGPELFIDATAAVGLDFVHFNGMTGEYYFSEMMGSGGALFDYDNDGDLDLYAVQGGRLEVGATAPVTLSDRLFRNDLQLGPDGSRNLRFTDVTAETGIEPGGYGMGVAAGDFDNDGWVDLYVTNFGPNRLLRNAGDGTFADVTAAAGAEDSRWSTSAAFLDFDHDGWLDLYVGNYVDFTLTNHQPCFAPTSARDYCTPLAYRPEPDRLLRNRGDGTFEDVSARAGILESHGGALGVVAADFDGDGRLDIYVANDQMANQLWMNRGAGRFEDEALLAGSALDRDGKPEASMGVAAADFDLDGDEDLFLTHLAGEKNTLYVNGGDGWFEDRSYESGLALASLPMTAFGAGWLDFDNDGWLDLLTVNGDVRAIESLVRAHDPFPMHQPNQLFRSLGATTDGEVRFAEVTERASSAFSVSEVSRGAAFGDVDNDGDADVVVFNNNGPARLLLNTVGQDRAWIGLELVGRGTSRQMLGARAAVVRDGRPMLWRRARTDGSYASANDPRVLFGLGDGTEIDAVRVEWPSGRREEWTDVPLGVYSTLREGDGRSLDHR